MAAPYSSSEHDDMKQFEDVVKAGLEHVEEVAGDMELTLNQVENMATVMTDNLKSVGADVKSGLKYFQEAGKEFNKKADVTLNEMHEGLDDIEEQVEKLANVTVNRVAKVYNLIKHMKEEEDAEDNLNFNLMLIVFVLYVLYKIIKIMYNKDICSFRTRAQALVARIGRRDRENNNNSSVIYSPRSAVTEQFYVDLSVMDAQAGRPEIGQDHDYNSM